MCVFMHLRLTLIFPHVACPAIAETSFPIPVWALAPIIVGGPLILGVVIIIVVKVVVIVAVSQSACRNACHM